MSGNKLDRILNVILLVMIILAAIATLHDGVVSPWSYMCMSVVALMQTFFIILIDK